MLCLCFSVMVWGLGFSVYGRLGLGFSVRVYGLGVWFRIYNLWFRSRVHGLWFRFCV
jgi:hypothetical protein